MKKRSGIWAVMFFNAISWIVMGAVVAVAIYTTNNANWAWLMLIPVLGGYSYKEHSDKEKDDADI